MTDRLDLKLIRAACHPSHTETFTFDRDEVQMISRLVSAAKNLRVDVARERIPSTLNVKNLIHALTEIDGLASALGPARNATTCRVCADTHRMTLDDRQVPCTHCPTPCEACRAGGIGAYCELTPCPCACHIKT